VGVFFRNSNNREVILKIVIQRVKKSSVTVSNTLINEIKHGITLFACIEKGDTSQTIIRASEKILKLRIFSDKMSKSICDIKGEILCISQFTLSWQGEKGNRPGFDKAMPPVEASILFKRFCNLLSEKVIVKSGLFGEHMEVSIVNDGPVTFHLEF